MEVTCPIAMSLKHVVTFITFANLGLIYTAFAINDTRYQRSCFGAEEFQAE